MRRPPQHIVIAATVALLVAVLSACGGFVERESADSAPSSSGAPTTEAEPAGDEQEEGRIGGSATGFTIEVTDDWVQIDVESGDLMDAVDEAGLPADADFVGRAAEQLAGTPGVVFALEFGPQIDLVDEFVTNLNGYCISSPTVPDLQQLAQVSERELGMVGAVDVEASETTAGTTAALRITYQLPTASFQLLGVQYVFVSADDDPCYLTFTTTELDDDLGRFDEIAATLRLS